MLLLVLSWIQAMYYTDNEVERLKVSSTIADTATSLRI